MSAKHASKTPLATATKSNHDIFLYKTRSSISKTYREPYQLDFFDIASVTDDEIREWVTKVGKHDYDTQRGKTYARQYNVADKIRRQKQEGTLQQTLSSTRTGWTD